MPVSFSPVVAPLTPLPIDLVIGGLSQSNDLFWGPEALAEPQPECFFLNCRISSDPANWTFNEGRDTLESPVDPALPTNKAYIVPSDAEPNFPPLPPGAHRGGSPWSWFMKNFASTPARVKPGGYQRLIVVLMGLHSMPISQFGPRTNIHDTVCRVHDYLVARGWPGFTYLNLAQGETDAMVGTDKQAYIDSVWSMEAGFRAHGIRCPIIIDQNTMVRLKIDGSPAGTNLAGLDSDMDRTERFRREMVIADAQREACDPARNIHRGINCDLIGNRIDGCHHGSEGHQRIGHLRYISLYDHIAARRIPAAPAGIAHR